VDKRVVVCTEHKAFVCGATVNREVLFRQSSSITLEL